MPPPSASAPVRSAELRRHNLGLLLGELRREPSSRAALAGTTGLTRGTVASLLDPLVAAGVLAEGPPSRGGIGRPGRPLRFAPDGPVAVGVSVEVDGLVACVVGLDGGVVRRLQRRRDHRTMDAAEVFGRAARDARALSALAGRPVVGAGVAVPAPVRGTGPDAEMLRAPNLPLLAGARPGELFGRVAGRPVVVGNEATLGALAHLGVASDFVYVSAGIGIGGGIVVGGRVLAGAAGLAGEIGHVVVERDGRPCGCGGTGCVERYAGLPALLADAGADGLPGLRAAVRAGEPAALAAVQRAGTALGAALASVLNVVDLPAVVLGGSYTALGDRLAPVVRAEILRRRPSAGVEVLVSAHGRPAAALGTARAVTDRVLDDPDLLLRP
ncbi:ROK family transcriptional regulator [Pseudonocardia kongjuensis]|uniref:ROK family transcriptional regulator n=1 Tax=Pseudonocardia kongjuensis TaxID=102227 RepID=A0ABN1XKR7_9PSEU